MRRVVVNSTPLIILSSIGRLDILKKLYSDIYIPEAVYGEIIAKNDSACQHIKKEDDWVHVVPISDRSEKKMYKARLHDGEVEVMILAQEKEADLVIIDDYSARKTADYLGLSVTGTIGVIMKAKEQGIVPAVDN